MSLTAQAHPERMTDNSPLFQRLGRGQSAIRPEGTAESAETSAVPSGLMISEGFVPNVETVGHFHRFLRDERKDGSSAGFKSRRHGRRFSKAICCAGVIISSASLVSAETVWLSSLDLSRMTCGWSVPKADLGVAGKPISIGGKQFTRGVGTHAESCLRVDLGGKASRFFAEVGLDDSAGGQGSVEFIVSGDGKILWRSGLLTGGKAPLPVDVNVSGVRVLALRVTDGGDGSGSDHADWGDAGIEMQAGAPKPTALLPYETFGLKTKTFALEFQVGDDGRLYQRALGAPAANEPPQRFDEAYPQWGDD